MAKVDEFANAYPIEFLCKTRPTVSKKALLVSLRKRCPGIEPADGDPTSGLLMFTHPGHSVRLGDAMRPAKTFLMERPQPPDPQVYEKAVQQSWQFPQAREKVRACSSVMFFTSNLLASSLERQERLPLYQDCVAATLDVMPCEAICWGKSMVMVDPQAFLAQVARPDYPRLFAGAVNVRLINVAGAPGDYVMDSVGLTAFGMPDVQCHFRQLKPNDVGPHLYDLALYLFARGDVIQDGQTVDGVPKGAKWRCHHERSLAQPERTVLDLDPGAPFAAGARQA